MPPFRLKNFSPDGLFHLHSACITAGLPAEAHTHEFAEMFLVTSGTGVHSINGESVPVNEGMLIFIRPDDRHTFKVKATQILHGINIAFSVSTLTYLKGRYFSESTDFWNDKNPMPQMRCLSADQIQSFIAQVNMLGAAPRSALSIERFLINILSLFEPAENFVGDYPQMPEWLKLALNDIASPRYFVNGAAGLVELACRSPEHVARTVQKFLHKTPSTVVNEMRIKYAVNQLSMSTKSIYEIALDCGLESLARFYQLFKKQTGMSPKQYRKKNMRIVA